MFDRFSHAYRPLIAARCLKSEQQLEIIFCLYKYERLPLASGRVAESVFIFKENAQVGLVCEKAFDLVATQIIRGYGSIKVVHELGLAGRRQVRQLKRAFGDASELLAPEFGIGASMGNQLFKPRPP
jgi:hypothetical protein